MFLHISQFIPDINNTLPIVDMGSTNHLNNIQVIKLMLPNMDNKDNLRSIIYQLLNLNTRKLLDM